MQHTRQTVLLIGDMLALGFAFLIMVLIRFNVGSNGSYIILQAKLFGLLFLIWLIIFFVFDLYTFKRLNPNSQNIGLIMLAIATGTLVGTVFFYLFPSTGVTPKTNLVIVSIFAFLFLTLWRRSFYYLYAKTFQRKIAVIGTSPLTTHLIEEIAHHPHIGIVLAVWDTIPSQPVSGIDLLIAEPSKPLELLLATHETNCEIFSLREAYESLFGKIPLELITESEGMDILTKAHSSSLGLALIYRSIEVVVSVCVLIVSLPFLLLAMVAIILEDGGPMFYRQLRVGKNKKTFTFYKLRSMVPQAELSGARWAEKNDNRLTRVGKVIRTLHIDEIPQMVNIITGDLALVGPRAERPEFVQELEQQIPYYFLRHTIKPGFTGWAQIKFRYARSLVDSREKFEYDVFYIKNRNFFFDIGILLKTVQIIFTHQ
jgi:lipopolysaccharide/colanic/teichoic acid biosynthesis glycosyltransferase